MTNKYGERMCDTEMKTKQKTWGAMSAEEKDALVAEKVMGWKSTGRASGIMECPSGSKIQYDYPSAFTTSLPAAFEVVEKLSGEFQFSMNTTCDKGLWDVSIASMATLSLAVDCVVFTPLPEAICLAALRAKGVEVFKGDSRKRRQ